MNQEMWTCEQCGTEATAPDSRLLTAMGWHEKPRPSPGDPVQHLCPVCAKRTAA